MAKAPQPGTEKINGLIAVLHDGVELHEKALEETGDTRVMQLAQSMIAERKRTIEELKPFVMQGGAEPVERGTFAGDARAMLTKLKAMVGDRDAAYSRELAKLEAMTVTSIEDCIEESADRQVATKLEERKKPFTRAAEELQKLGDGG